jgi:hypothetical protein
MTTEAAGRAVLGAGFGGLDENVKTFHTRRTRTMDQLTPFGNANRI